MDLPPACIRSAIREKGCISFARFMELALYEPGTGYYERAARRLGKQGDFYTSVSVGSLFGELLAARFAAWLVEDEAAIRMESGQRAGHRIVEAGAHDGRLAADILNWLRREEPARFERAEYWILEPSLTRRQWQRETLAEFGASVRWFGSWSETGPIQGVVFANELLDAFPVHRLVWSKSERQWREAMVTEIDGRFVWTSAPLPELPSGAEHLADLPGELAAVLPDGFATEVCPGALRWWRDAAQALAAGRLLTFDYGLEASEFLNPTRANGTLRAYRNHQLADEPLANPGEQDLTAHVNFTAVRAAGERAGLGTETMDTQGLFLTRVATQLWPGANDALWTPERIRQFQTLTHPQHLGHSFRVLVQRRTLGGPSSARA